MLPQPGPEAASSDLGRWPHGAGAPPDGPLGDAWHPIGLRGPAGLAPDELAREGRADPDPRQPGRSRSRVHRRRFPRPPRPLAGPRQDAGRGAAAARRHCPTRWPPTSAPTRRPAWTQCSSTSPGRIRQPWSRSCDASPGNCGRASLAVPRRAADDGHRDVCRGGPGGAPRHGGRGGLSARRPRLLRDGRSHVLLPARRQAQEAARARGSSACGTSGPTRAWPS